MLALSDFRARRGRYLLTVVAIAVSVALTVALSAVSEGARAYVDNALKRIYPADIMLYSDSINIPTRLVEALGNAAGEAQGIVIATGVYGGKAVTVIGVPLAHMDYFSIDLKEGRLPSGGGEAVVEDSLGLRPGDSVTITIYSTITGGEKRLQLRVVGVMTGFLRGFIGAFRLNLVVVPLDWLQDQLDAGPFVNAVLITVRDKGQVGPLAEYLKARYRGAQVYTQRSLLETANRVFTALDVVFGVISGAALVAAAVSTFAVMSITARERLREFGLLKAMGIPSSSITASVLVEVAIMALAGGVAGTIVGYLGANSVKGALSVMGVAVEVPVVLSPSVVLLGLLTSFAVALLGAFLPMYRVARMRPLEILRSWQ